ncbi:MAG: hypothetical protein HGA67_03485 [Candidatus Yonathbacteria bacterium]|nr:hypothetical protein [Candidatus Yonathbacteria bacterium]
MKQCEQEVVLDACTRIFVHPYNLRVSILGNDAHGYEFMICMGDAKRRRTLVRSRRFILSDTVDSMIDKVEKFLTHIYTTVGQTFFSFENLDDITKGFWGRSDFLTPELIMWIVKELRKEHARHIHRADTWEYRHQDIPIG